MNYLRKTLGLPLAAAGIAVLLLAAACGGTVPTSQPAERTPTTAPTAGSTETAVEDAAVQPTQTTGTSAETPGPVATPSSETTDGQTGTDETPGSAETREPDSVSTPSTVSKTVGGEVGDQAPEFTGISNWINSPELSMAELRGQVVLIDFWTYTCVNCLRTLPYIKDWNTKYADKGLVIVGVHTPEFDFEKVTDNVVRSAQENEVSWAIAQDNDFKTWRSYNNRYWPAKYLVDQEGAVRYTHFGEGAYVETEEQIRSLLQEAGADLSGVAVSEQPAPKVDPRAYTTDPALRITREIYGGFGRNASPQGIYISHQEYYEGPNRTVFYTDPGEHMNQFMYLQGPWENGFEQIKHARETENYEDYIALQFVATSVNAVIDPEGGDPFEVQVTIDGRPLTEEEAGTDLMVENGRSFFEVDEPRMYEVIALPDFGNHELKLSSNSPDFSLFAFTFGAYEEGP